jgi:hypothetical protein
MPVYLSSGACLSLALLMMVAGLQSLSEVKALFESASCRRAAILQYFGETLSPSTTRCRHQQKCDYCMNPEGVKRVLTIAKSSETRAPMLLKVPKFSAEAVRSDGKWTTAGDLSRGEYQQQQPYFGD